MAKSNSEKGRALERAVRVIQETIFRSDPALKGAKFTIESNQIIKVADVRHELDLLITVHPDTDFRTTFVLECKNWKAVVGKNEVIVLAEKVSAMQASRGFLFAPKFSRDAKAQAKASGCVELVQCTDNFANPLDELQFLLTTYEVGTITVQIAERGVTPNGPPLPLEWREQLCQHHGRPIDFRTFLNEIVDRLMNDLRNENSPKHRLEGIHHSQIGSLIEFDCGEFLLGERDVARLAVNVPYTLFVRKPRLLSKVAIERRGAVFSYEFDDAQKPDRKFVLDLVTTTAGAGKG